MIPFMYSFGVQLFIFLKLRKKDCKFEYPTSDAVFVVLFDFSNSIDLLILTLFI